jgi:hypothetical protein
LTKAFEIRRRLAIGGSIEDDDHQPWSANNFRDRTRKLPLAPLHRASFAICSPPWPPARRITTAFGAEGVRTMTRSVMPARDRHVDDFLRDLRDRQRRQRNKGMRDQVEQSNAKSAFESQVASR